LLGLLSDDPMVANGPTSPRTSECGMWQSVSHISQVPFSLLPALKKNSRLPLLLFSASPPRHSWLAVNFESSTIRQRARRVAHACSGPRPQECPHRIASRGCSTGAPSSLRLGPAGSGAGACLANFDISNSKYFYMLNNFRFCLWV
jgi:hypothetical protein